jgi:hypothetical protein
MYRVSWLRATTLKSEGKEMSFFFSLRSNNTEHKISFQVQIWHPRFLKMSQKKETPPPNFFEDVRKVRTGHRQAIWSLEFEFYLGFR